MKKIMKKLNVAIVGAMASGAAMAANAGAKAPNINDTLCELAAQFGGIFSTLRTLAFIGAAFTIASWAWGYISSGKVEFKDIQGKGIGMLVGFFLLFGVGVIVSAFMSMAGDGGSLGCVVDAF
ncbi:MAG: hypothetical protein II208_04140 [Alphaproteobacteria bacterium]|nr:hypothetical protein [Alphaproteobacteria bacterium]